MITTLASFFINGKVQSHYLCVLFNHDSINIGGGGSMTKHIREICLQKRHFLVILFLRITYLGKIWIKYGKIELHSKIRLGYGS